MMDIGEQPQPVIVNALLAEARAAVHEVRKLVGVSEDPLAELAVLLADRVDALDRWMCDGGLAPDAWLPSRLAMLQAEYKRGFEAAMLHRRSGRLQVPGAPVHYETRAEPLGPPNPADADEVTHEDVVTAAERLNEQTREKIRARGEDPDEVLARAIRGLRRKHPDA